MLNKLFFLFIYICSSSMQISANDSLLVNSKWTLMYTLILHGDTIIRNGESYIRENTEIGTGNNGGPTLIFKNNHTLIKIDPIGSKKYWIWSLDKDTLIMQRNYKKITFKEKYLMSFENKKRILYLSPVFHQKTIYVFGKRDDEL